MLARPSLSPCIRPFDKPADLVCKDIAKAPAIGPVPADGLHGARQSSIDAKNRFVLPGQIDPPAADAVVVTARSVDTNDDQEFEQTWRGRVAEFDSLLTSAVALIETWKSRAS